MNNNNTYDYAVIGAGIVGLSTALHLRKQNVSVVVLEKEKSQDCINLDETLVSSIQEFITPQIQVSQNFL